MKRSITVLFASFTMLVAAPAWAQNSTAAPKAGKPAIAQPGSKLTPTVEKKSIQRPASDDKASDDKAAEAGPNHKLLAQVEGEWDTVTTEYGEDGKVAATDKGTTTAKMVMGGRFLDFSYDGRSHGKFARGTGIMGYSNAEKHFEQYYAESTSTEIAYMTGSADSAGKVITLSGKAIDPATGKAVTKKCVLTITSKDSCKEEVFVSAGGKEAKVAELAYTRSTGQTKAEKKEEKHEPRAKAAPTATPASKK